MDFNFILNKKCYRAALSQINLRGEWHSASAYFPWKYPDIITQFSTLCPSGSFGPQLFPSTCVRDEPYTHWFSIIKSVIPTQMLAKPVKQESYSKFLFLSCLNFVDILCFMTWHYENLEWIWSEKKIPTSLLHMIFHS